MHPIDWLLAVAPIFGVLACALYTRRYIQGVADFVAGGRAAGRYIICNAKGEASTGVANTLSKFQPLLVSGFVLAWWDALSVPIIMLFAIGGFVVYRYRQTRAMTVGQFFEMRYSRRFRLFAGVVGFVAGILNYGIFPAVSSDFFIYFLNLPLELHVGSAQVPTRAVIMASYLACTLCMMILGGQITLLVTDCVEGIFSHLVWVIVVIAIFFTITWSQMRGVLSSAPPGHSLINPFDQGRTHDFNLWYALITLSMTVYGFMTIQKDNGFATAARTPHEARMGNVLGWWRTMARSVLLAVLALGAMTYMRQPHFPGDRVLASIADGQLRSQMSVPVALRFLLPPGIKGLFCAVMVLGLMSGDASHILTWGGIFIQDVVLPMRTRPMTPKQHVLYLRLALVGVASFAFVFSLLFHQTQYIAMWWAVTEGIFAAGAGAAIIGGLYWRHGSTAGAWSAFVVGTTTTLAGIVLPYCFRHFPVNGAQVRFIAAGLSVAAYILVSLATSRGGFDMDRLLHRGRYAVASDMVAPSDATPTRKRRWSLRSFLGIDDDFSFWDKIVSAGIFGWSMFWLGVVVIGTTWNLLRPWSNAFWASYWLVVGIVLPFAVAAVTLVWFGIGGAVDLHRFFARLASMKRDIRDDGTVSRPDQPPQEQTAVIPGHDSPAPRALASG